MPTETNLEYCPASGLVIFRDPKWQHCTIQEHYYVDFCFIGRRILLITHHGDTQYQDIRKFYRLREQFLAESFTRFGSSGRVVEMRDYGDTFGMPSKETRVKQIQYLYENRHQILGLIIFNMSVKLRSIIRMGLSLSRSPFPVELVKDYTSAITKALDWVKAGRENDVPIVSDLPDWSRTWGEFSVSFGQIGNRILLTRPKGWMRAHHINSLIDLYRNLRRRLFSHGEPYIQIADYTGLQGADLGVRFRLAKAYQRLNQEPIAPLALILVDTSAVLKATFMLARRWFRVHRCQNMAEALNLCDTIFKDRKGRIDLTSRNVMPQDPFGNYIQEMIEYVASFGWDDEQKQAPNVFEGHPFRSLFEALELVRYDLDELLKKNLAAKEELAEKEAYYRGLYELTADAIILFDGRDRRPVDANPAALSLFGCMNLEQFRGIAWWRFLAGGEKSETQFSSIIEQAQKKGGVRTDWELRTLEGRTFVADIQFNALPRQGFSMVMAVMRDMTEKRRVEEEIRNARDAAQKANEAKNEFLANMSHEVRTPLNGILGLTEILLEEENDGQRMDHLRDIKRSGETLLDIVNEILDFSRIDTGRIQIEKMEFDMVGLVRRVIRMFAVKCHERGLEMLCDFEPAAVGICFSDPVKLRQILINLVGNAVKFTENGFVMLTVRTFQDASMGNGVRFVVRDTGIGIADDYIPKIFERFFQVDRSMNRRQGGTGLGLSISKRLVTALGGTISVTSKLGDGSSFEVELPVENFRPSMLLPKQHSIKSHCILVYEPYPMARMILLDLLTQLGQTAIECVDDDDFLSQLDKQYTFLDGIILSLGQNEVILDRLQDCLMKKAEGRKPLLMLSHGRSLKIKGQLLQLGVTDTVLKPILPNELMRWLLSIDKKTIAEGLKESVEPEVATHRKSMKVLVAEDNEINQKMINRLLIKNGCQVVLARDGQEAVNLYFSGGADVVLMDLQMPVMDGYQAAQIIRDSEREGSRRVPIVALTAHAQSTHMEKSFASGMDAYLTKPISIQALYGLLERLQENLK